jgi:hypothetical protein
MKTMQRLIIGMLVSSVLTMTASAATTNDATSGGVTIAAGLTTPVVLEGAANFLTYPCAAADVVKVVYIPSNFVVQAVTAECVTTNTGTASAFIVGDSVATNTYLSSAISMILPDAAVTQCTNSYANGGQLYTSPSFVSIVPTIAVTNGSAKVRVLGVKLGP